MAKSREYQKVYDKRENAIRAIKFHIEKSKDLTNEQPLQALQRLNAIENAYEKYKTANEAIEDHDEFVYNEMLINDEDVVDMYIVVTSKLKEISKEMLDSSMLNSTTHSTRNNTLDVKLPRIEIPVFDGKYEEWASFSDAFISLIDQREGLSDQNKMHYLIGALKGTALKSVSRLKVTNDNYKIAFKTLSDRFDNKRAIVNACVKTLLDQPSLRPHSANDIRILIDTTKESLQCIENQNILTDEWAPLVIYFVETKMDERTRTEWETHLGGSTDLPKYRILFAFLETQFRILNSCTNNSEESKTSLPNTKSSVQNKTQSIKNTESNVSHKNKSNNSANFNERCPLCQENHWLLMCQKFIEMQPNQRKEYAIANSICIVCLKIHEKDKCKSNYRCKLCLGAHSVKLHTEVDESTVQSTSNTINSLAIQEGGNLFATALIKVKDKYETNHVLRVFIDMGSGGAFISEKAAQLLCLPRKRENRPLTGVDNVSLGKSTNSVRLQIESIVSPSFKLTLNTHVIRTIISPRHFDEDTIASCKHLNNIELADPQYLKPSHIDILFGVDIYGIILKNGLRKGQIHEPIAQNSHLGWLIMGANSNQQSMDIQINSLSIENELKRFWENEEIFSKPILSDEHSKCVEHFKNTHSRLSNGELMVSLPFNINPNDSEFLGNSKKMALCRFFHVEKRFRRDSLYKQRYVDEMNSYIKLKHMSLCEDDENEGYYLPHHAVVRESSTTTKQRTVYDASAKTTNGKSLNDRCLNGPTIQPELIDIFIRWRIHKIAINADIEKMYRMIRMHPNDRKFQKILWRSSENEPIKTYELNTVTFGTKPAPYLAIASTFALADSEKHNFPEAAKRIKSDFYVDDCMSGSHSIQSAISLQRELDNLCKSGNFLLRKWASNEPAVLANIPIENRAIKQTFELNTNESIKTLGLLWTPSIDELSFKIDMKAFYASKSSTKRQLLSDASKIFDPCGYLSPITIKAKIAMQDIWKSGTDWDSVIPREIQCNWNVYMNELPLIEKIKIKRWFNTTVTSNISLHGFCDSSEKAMACAIYIIQKTNNESTSMLVCAKTKVAPIAAQTIPRLELNGAVLLAKLMERVSQNLKISKELVHLWTDSSIVLMWLQKHASHWPPYIAARVRNIQELFNANHWSHVRTYENPADIATRGVLPSVLLQNSLWFQGPNWLIQDKSEWPKLEFIQPASEKLKSDISINMIQMENDVKETEFLTQYRDFYSLIRITSFILRFVQQCKKKETLKYTKHVITVNEINRAEMFWVKYVQSLYFKKEIKCLKANKNISEKSSLRALNPQFNENGLLIVHGRLQYADFSILRKFPIILPAKSNFSKLIVGKAHNRSNHGSIHLTLATLRQEYWVLNARNMVKSHIHKCIICYRQNPKQMTQLMAPIPKMKTSPARAFLHCGMDFAGPFNIKISNRRNASTNKGYICVFVCMVSKAVHLELVSDLSTARFIMAFRRFISRRGFCTDIYCDNGTNFKGAGNELPLLMIQAESEASVHIQNTFAHDKIKFHFNPPSAPHWGGQWESYVKLTKHHLNRISVSIQLTFEEMSTLLTQIEACINSRPLCAITNDVNDLDPLTAGHLLIGSALNLIPEPSVLSLKDTTLDRFQAIQKGVQTFWKRFYIEYLHTMHPRKKWYKPGEELNVNDLVVIIDDNLPPAKWLMGRVLEIHPGRDGLVRMVTLQTKSKDNDYGKGDSVNKKPQTLQRPIAKICKLPIANEFSPSATSS